MEGTPPPLDGELIEKTEADVLDEFQDIKRAESDDSSDRAFQDALRKLPDHADLSEEMDWISCHPAMMRLDRKGTGRSKTGRGAAIPRKIKLTTKDIKDAPSRRAANGLQHWVNDPKTFQKMIVAEYQQQRRKAADDKDKYVGSGIVIDDTEEVERILRSL